MKQESHTYPHENSPPPSPHPREKCSCIEPQYLGAWTSLQTTYSKQTKFHHVKKMHPNKKVYWSHVKRAPSAFILPTHKLQIWSYFQMIRSKIHGLIGIRKCTIWSDAKQLCEWTDCSKRDHAIGPRSHHSGTAWLWNCLEETEHHGQQTY
jgi:hypothetical protein